MCPFIPLPLVLPTPEPIPRPTRLRFFTLPAGGFRLLSSFICHLRRRQLLNCYEVLHFVNHSANLRSVPAFGFYRYDRGLTPAWFLPGAQDARLYCDPVTFKRFPISSSLSGFPPENRHLAAFASSAVVYSVLFEVRSADIRRHAQTASSAFPQRLVRGVLPHLPR